MCGERFVLYRLPPTDPATQARRALAHAGREKAMRAELAGTVAEFLNHLDPEPGLPPREEDDERLIGLATLVVRARSAVERDGYSREIELIPEPEAPTRLVVVLRRLMQGLDAIGLDSDTAWAITSKAALDSIPTLRLEAIGALHAAGEAIDTNAVASRVSYPASTTRRALEELTAHGLVDCHRQGEGRPHLWTLTTFALERVACFPEMSSSIRSGGDKETQPEPEHTPSDVSGTVIRRTPRTVHTRGREVGA
jgi:DNA-binding transcriptional ArsR family regulator